MSQLDLNDVKEESRGKLVPLFPRRELTARPWVVKGFAMRGNVTALFGEPGSGKSLITLHMAIAVASGRDYGPFAVVEPGPVLMVNREDDIAETDRRTWGIEQVQSIPEDCPVHRLDRPSVHIAMRDPEGGLVTTEFHDELRDHIRSIGARLVVLDPMIELGGNLSENDNIEMNFLVEKLRELAQQTDSAILMVHHTNKGGMGMNGMRGASAIAGRVRAANQFMHLPDKYGLDLPGHPREFRVLSSAKQNYAPSAADHHFQSCGFLHEPTDEWSPAMKPVLLKAALDEFAVAKALDGQRHYERGGDVVYTPIASEYGVKASEVRVMAQKLIDEDKLKLEDRHCPRAKERKPHYVLNMEDPMPF